MKGRGFCGYRLELELVGKEGLRLFRFREGPGCSPRTWLAGRQSRKLIRGQEGALKAVGNVSHVLLAPELELPTHEQQKFTAL